MCRFIGYIALTFALGACHASPPPPAANKGPELYGAGLFTTGAWDFFLAFSPDQTDVLHCRADDAFEAFDIFETRRNPSGRWSPPLKPRFATQGSNADPHIAPDGKTVFFISNRPLSGRGAVRPTFDIWFAERQADGAWGDAQRLAAPFNDAKVDHWSPMVAANGNLYFGGERAGGRGGSDLWVARKVDGTYLEPENLGEAINTQGHEVEPWIAPDESYLIFSALRRADSVGSYDLYVSRRIDGAWEKARPLSALNTPAREFNQSVTPDGKWLYFSSTRPYQGPLGERFDDPRDERAVAGIGDGKKGDIYRVAMSELGLAPSK
ncbi:Xaa-Pro aminopeptidase [Pendulispora brunnea]|uniref:Xaa-Pro aminopeptidase n=1 Tax=Pendulispora brunnea TaxID=2905690 RepID=A0ABZ2KCQ8_9BACT